MSNQYLNNKSFESVIASFQKWKKEKKRYELIKEDFGESATRIKNKNHKHTVLYIENHQRKYDEICVNFTKFQDELASAFYLLGENITRYYRPYGIDADDAVQEAVLLCFEKLDKFDPSKGKAFTYMTTCILNHYRHIWRTHRNYNELKKKYQNFLLERTDRIFISGYGSDRIIIATDS